MGEERPWEKSYPPGVRWDAPIEMSTLPGCSMRFTDEVGAEARAGISRPHDELRRVARRGRAVASGLMDLGVGPGTAVALYLPNTPYHPIAFFAALSPGRASCTSLRSMPSASWPSS